MWFPKKSVGQVLTPLSAVLVVLQKSTTGFILFVTDLQSELPVELYWILPTGLSL